MAISASLQPDTVARLMARYRDGDHEAAGELVELFYPSFGGLPERAFGASARITRCSRPQ